MNTQSQERLVDELIDAYVEWRDACTWVNDAYRSWTRERGPGESVAFGLYMAALDAEEHAAEVYAELLEHTYKRLWGEVPPAKAIGGRAGGVGWS